MFRICEIHQNLYEYGVRREGLGREWGREGRVEGI